MLGPQKTSLHKSDNELALSDSQRIPLIEEEFTRLPHHQATISVSKSPHKNPLSPDGDVSERSYHKANPTFMQKREQAFNGQRRSSTVSLMPNKLAIQQRNSIHIHGAHAAMLSNRLEEIVKKQSLQPVSPKSSLRAKHNTLLLDGYLAPTPIIQTPVLRNNGRIPISSKVNLSNASFASNNKNKASLPKSMTSANQYNHQMSESLSENEYARTQKEDKNQKNIKIFKNVVKEKKKKDQEKKQQSKVRPNRRNTKSLTYGSLGSQKTDNNIKSAMTGLKRFKVMTRQSTMLKAKTTTMSDQDDQQEETNEDDFKRIERNFERSKFTFFPDSNFRTFWDLVSMLLIVYWSLYLPFSLAFNTDNGTQQFFSAMDTISQIWFLLDIVFNFNTGFLSKGILVMNRKKITLNYLKTWFFLDFLASFPYDWVILSVNNSHEARSQIKSTKVFGIMRTFRYLKIMRLIRVVKADRLLVHIEDQIASDLTNAILRFSKLMIVTFFFAHWMACLFFGIASIQNDRHGESWIVQSNVQDAHVSEQYVSALYWCITTMATVGYGDIKPQTTEERAMCIFIMLIAAGFYAYIINDVGHIVSNYNLLAAQYKEKMVYVNQFMNQKGLPKELRDKIHRYLEYNWEFKKKIKIEEDELFELLNNELKDQIRSHITGRILIGIEFFEKTFKLDFMSELIKIFQRKSFAIDDNIIFEDQIGNEIFFVIQGKVAIIHKKTHTFISELFKDTLFGEISFFGDVPRTCSAKSRDFTETYVIHKDDFLSIACDFPDAIVMYNRIKDSLYLGQKDYKLLKIRCYLCSQKKDHIAIDCKYFKNVVGNLKINYNLLHKNDKKKKNTSAMNTQQNISEIPSPLFFKNNLTVPRQSFSQMRSDLQYRESFKERQGVDEDYLQILEIMEEQRRYLERGSFVTDEDMEDMVSSRDFRHDHHDMEHLRGSNWSKQKYHAQQLEDIKEDDLEEQEANQSQKTLQKQELLNLQNYLQTSEYQNSVKSKIKSKPRSSLQLPQQKFDFQQEEEQLVEKDSKSVSDTDNSSSSSHQTTSHQSSLRTSQNITHLNDQTQLNKSNTGKDSQLDIKQPNIRPFKAIRRNTLVKRLKLKTGKMFCEDFVQDIQQTNDPQNSPKRVVKNKMDSTLVNGSTNEVIDPFGFQTFISSSRDSQDWQNIVNKNSQALLVKKKRKETVGEEQGSSQQSKVFPKSKASNQSFTSNVPKLTKLGSASSRYDIKKDDDLSFNTFQMIKNSQFNKNHKGNATNQNRQNTLKENDFEHIDDSKLRSARKQQSSYTLNVSQL